MLPKGWGGNDNDAKNWTVVAENEWKESNKKGKKDMK